MTGRPSEFTEQVAGEICRSIAEGKSLRAICDQEDMPSKPTVLRWLGDEKNADFRSQYARAREAQADHYAEEIVEIADAATDAQLGRLKMDARRWAASKLAPKKYGDKVALTGGADGDEPLKHALTVTFVKAST